jgi:hypothetical protein
MRRREVIAVSCAAIGIASVLAIGGAQADPASKTLAARDDAYLLSQGSTLRAKASVFENDTGDPTAIVSNTKPTHGALSLNPDGTFTYVPEAGFAGIDTFTYTTSDAVKLYKTNLPPLATIGGVKITGGAYGSSLAPVPGSKDDFYGLTDRGPNVDAPDGAKIEPLPDFHPAIGRFRMDDGEAVLKQTIVLKSADGTPYNGQVNAQADTGETIENLDGVKLPASPNGYDPEGLVAAKDGTFWVSDEYGPFITHFDSKGRAIGRLSPFDGSLPAELAKRVPNKGMEGLTLTPDGQTLVGIMQSALQQTDLTKKPASVVPLRIVTYNLKSHATKEYLYLLDDPKTNSGAVSEITALTDTTFVVDERDGKVEPGAYKKLFKIDISGATDVGPAASVPGANYVGTVGGLLVGPQPQKTIENYVGTADTATATTLLAAVGITPVSKMLDVDLGALVTRLDPSGGFFGHDKVEGVATIDKGKTLWVSNDNDFGLNGVTNTAAPFQLGVKVLPNGTQDDGEYLAIDTTRLGNATSTATVSIYVTPIGIHK